MSDIFKRHDEARAAVTEIEQKKRAHLRMIEEKKKQLLQLRSTNREEAQAQAAAAFFRNEPGASISIVDLENDLRKLHSQTPLFDVEMKTRQRALAALSSEHQAAAWKPLKVKDDANKAAMAEALISLAKCCAAEYEIEEEMRQAETVPPAEFRIMRPTLTGSLKDPSSWINLWLRELREAYPHIKVKV